MTADLFGEPLIAGLDYRPGFISAEEERALVEHLSASSLRRFVSRAGPASG